MMKRQIFLRMGLLVLFLSFGLVNETIAGEYTIRKGDTLSLIARRNGVSVQELKEANNLRSSALKVRQVIVIPQHSKPAAKSSGPSRSLTSYIVKKGDTLSAISSKAGLPVSEIKKINGLRRNALKVGQKLLLKQNEQNDREEAADVAAAGEPEEEEDGGLEGDAPEEMNVADKASDASPGAEFLGTWQNPEEPKLFVKVARAFLGTPYRFGGISLRGLDCSAFVKKVYQIFDISLPRTAREQAKVGVGVARDDLKEGDLVFFNTRRSFGHVGIYIGNNEFVHTSSRQKSVRISNLDEPYFKKRFVKAVRLKGMDGDAL